MSYLELKDLCKRYPGNPNLIVKSMNLSIEKGEFVVFLGPSGCGKTTTIRMISGLEDVSSGDILIQGGSIAGLKPKDRNVSMIFQSYAVWPHMTVYENIAYPLKLRKMGKAEIAAKVRAAAAATHIGDYLDRYPSQLSGGQRQRVAVARSIAIEPKIFLMDEPLSNLDAKLRVSMRTELKNIHLNLNATTIFVTHDQSEAMSLADRIVIMKDGEIEQCGTPSEVYYDSETRFVASFIGTPPTNFYSVRIESKDGELVAVGEQVEYRVPPLRRDALRPYVGKEVDLGVRPECLVPAGKDAAGSPFARGTVVMTEPQGSHTIVIAMVGGVETKIMVMDDISFGRNEALALSVKNDSAMFFDKETSRRIRA